MSDINCIFCKEKLFNINIHDYTCDNFLCKKYDVCVGIAADDYQVFYFSILLNHTIYVMWYYVKNNLYHLDILNKSKMPQQIVYSDLNDKTYPDITPENVLKKLPLYLTFQ